MRKEQKNKKEKIFAECRQEKKKKKKKKAGTKMATIMKLKREMTMIIRSDIITDYWINRKLYNK